MQSALSRKLIMWLSLPRYSYSREDVKAGRDKVKSLPNAYDRWIWCKTWYDWIVIRYLTVHSRSLVDPHPAFQKPAQSKVSDSYYSQAMSAFSASRIMRGRLLGTRGEISDADLLVEHEPSLGVVQCAVVLENGFGAGETYESEVEGEIVLALVHANLSASCM